MRVFWDGPRNRFQFMVNAATGTHGNQSIFMTYNGPAIQHPKRFFNDFIQSFTMANCLARPVQACGTRWPPRGRCQSRDLVIIPRTRGCGAARGRGPSTAAATAIVPSPPIRTAGTVPTSEATRPDSKAPSWFEVPVKSECTALTRPRISSGVRSCTSETRMTTLTTSAAPRTESATSERTKLVERPKTTVAAPKTMTARKRVRPIPPLERIARQEDRRQQGAHGRRRAQEPEPGGARAQDVARVDGQERGGAAQQDGEQVERHRAEQHRPVPDEGDPREHRLERDGRARAAPCAGAGSPRRTPRPARTARPPSRRPWPGRARTGILPAAGPTIWAVWFAETSHAMARATRDRGTTSGTMAVIVGFSNARAAPTRATRARMLVLLCQPPRVPRTSVAVAAALTI